MTKFDAPLCEACGSRRKSLFQNLGVDELGQLDEAKSCFQFRKGDAIVSEGQYPKGIYCLNSGAVKVHKAGSEGKPQIVYFAQGGHFIGYVSLISETPYHISATALTDTTACFIPRQNFESLLKRNPFMNRGVMQALCREIALENERLVSMAQKTVRERLAEVLIQLHNTFAEQGPETWLEVALPREDIANLVGTATETTIRLLSEFKRDGLIETKGKRIRIAEPHKLRQIARLSTTESGRKSLMA